MRVVACALQGTGSLTLPPPSSWSRAANGLSRLTAQSLCMLSGDTPPSSTVTEAIPRGYRVTTSHAMHEHVDSHTHGARVVSTPESNHTLAYKFALKVKAVSMRCCRA